MDALEARGTHIDATTAIGGGARSPLWLRILATALDRPLTTIRGADIGPALGAARLAILATERADPRAICTTTPTDSVFAPVPELAEGLAFRRGLFRQLYPALRDLFVATAAPC